MGLIFKQKGIMDEIFAILKTWEHRKNPLAVHMLLYFITHASSSSAGDLQRGQVIAGRGKLQKVLQASEWMVRKTMEKLKTSGKISIGYSSGKAVITVCDYDKYLPEKENALRGNLQVYNYRKCGKQVHDKVDMLLARPEFTERKGLLKFVIPINQGGSREPQVSFENDVGIEVRAGIEVVRKEKIHI